MMKEFAVSTNIYFGEGALERLAALPYRKVLIFTDPFVAKSGLIRQVTDRLERAGIRYEVDTDVVPDPPVEKVASGIAVLLKSRPDCIVAVGGGSAIDLAKAVRKSAQRVDETCKPSLIAIPTTSGTGSEVTSFAVVTDREKGVKYPLVAPDMVPDEAILDVEMVKSVPAGVTADTGMDVLTHAMEAYVSTAANDFSDALAEKAVSLVGQYLLRSQANAEDTEAREKMHTAACLAGLAFNAVSLGLNHGMAHQLGAQFHIPHGRANAILLPYIVEYNAAIGPREVPAGEYSPCVRKYCNLARILGLAQNDEATTIRALAGYIRFLNQEMGIPLRVSGTGTVGEADYLARIGTMANAALADACTATNPRVPTAGEVMALYRKVF